jgi:5-methylthioadenosine/S-adenosylhomocysteine deaminase
VLAAHCVHLSDEDLAVFARHDVRVAHCPKSNGKLGSGIARLADLRAAGVCVAIGTDGAASNDRLDVLEETRFACLLARASGQDALALSSGAALAMATTDGRHALGMAGAELEPGDPADVVLIDARGTHAAPPHDAASTLLFAAQCGDVTDVFVDGRALLRDRRLLAIDEEWVQSEVARLAQRLRGA